MALPSYYPIDPTDTIRMSESAENETQIFHPRMGPFVRNGVVYGVFQGPATDVLTVWKSADGGATWVLFDGPALPPSSYGSPAGDYHFATTHAFDVRRSGLNRDGDLLYIGYIALGGSLAFTTFDMSADSFGAEWQYPSSPNFDGANKNPAFMIASRPVTDEVYFVYNTPETDSTLSVVTAVKFGVNTGVWTDGPSLGFTTGVSLEALAEDWDAASPSTGFWIRVWGQEYNGGTLRGALVLASIKADDTSVSAASVADWYGGSPFLTGSAFDPAGFLGKSRSGGVQSSNFGPAAAYGDDAVVAVLIETNQFPPSSGGVFGSSGEDLWAAIRLFTAVPADSPVFTEQNVYEDQGSGSITLPFLPQRSLGYVIERDGDGLLRIVYNLSGDQEPLYTIASEDDGATFDEPTLIFAIPDADYDADYGVHWDIGLGPASTGTGWSIFFGYGNIDNQNLPSFGESPDTAWYPPGRPYYMESSVPAAVFDGVNYVDSAAGSNFVF